MPVSDWEIDPDHALAELAALGIRHPFGATPNDAWAFVGYLVMAIKFALIVRPEFRELRLAAAMYDVWRNPVQPLPGPARPPALFDDDQVRGHSPDMRPSSVPLTAEQLRPLLGAFVPPTDDQLRQVLAGLKAMS